MTTNEDIMRAVALDGSWNEGGSMDKHDPYECPLTFVAPCGFCAARCSHDHTEECETLREERKSSFEMTEEERRITFGEGKGVQ